MTNSTSRPAWIPAVDKFGAAVFGILVGVASAAWQTRGAIAEQTQAIASLQQCISDTVRPALAKVEAHDGQLANQNMRLAVIERTCCGETTAAPTRATTTAVTP